MFSGPDPHDIHQAIEIGQQQVACLAHLQREGRVDHVGGGHAEVQPARRRPDVLGDGGREGDDVVLGGAFDLVDPCRVDRSPLDDVAGRVGRHETVRRHRAGRGRFDAQPGVVLTLVAPEATHRGGCVAGNHETPIN